MSKTATIIVGGVLLFSTFILIGMIATDDQSPVVPAKQETPAKVVMLTTTGPLPACTRPSDLGALTAIKNDRTYYRYIAEHEGCMEIPAGRTMMAQCSSDSTYRVCFIQSNRGERYMVKLIDGSYQITE